jgi:hypothetical protein
MVVSGSEAAATEVIERINGRIREAGGAGAYIPAKGGFGNAIDRETDAFLKS